MQSSYGCRPNTRAPHLPARSQRCRKSRTRGRDPQQRTTRLGNRRRASEQPRGAPPISTMCDQDKNTDKIGGSHDSNLEQPICEQYVNSLSQRCYGECKTHSLYCFIRLSSAPEQNKALHTTETNETKSQGFHLALKINVASETQKILTIISI